MNEPDKFELSPQAKKFIEGLVLHAAERITDMVLDQMAMMRTQVGLLVNSAISKELGIEGPVAKKWSTEVETPSKDKPC